MSPSISKIYSGELDGIDAHLIEVEVDLQVGLHSFTIVGLADKAVHEARERVSGAIKNSGAKPPNRENRKVTINLAPATVPKFGSHYDVPIAIGYLLATKQMRSFDAQSMLFAGELSLRGELRRIRGALNIALLAQHLGLSTIVVPRENMKEVSCVKKLSVIAPATLKELIDILEGNIVAPEHSDEKETATRTDSTSFASIHGQHHAKRALAIAAAGHHNVLLSGPPGVGKSMLAQALPSILPNLSEKKAIEVTRIQSAAGLFPANLITRPPFRSPHHTASLASMIGGGGGTLRPGEITLAHHGVLFLDELPEFQRPLLESLREPLESGVLELSRARGPIRLPAMFMLLAAMNPCPCGYYGDTEKSCSCSQQEIGRYRRKVSGPLLDRFDLHVTVSRPDMHELYKAKTSTDEQESLQASVTAARAYSNGIQNGLRSGEEIKNIARLTPSAEHFLDSLKKASVSPRGYIRLMKTARTIADMEGSVYTKEEHLAEAFNYRLKV